MRTPKGNGKKVDPFTGGFDPECGEFTPLDSWNFVTPEVSDDDRSIVARQLQEMFDLS